MLNPQKTLEREAMLKRIRELDAESRSMSAICTKVRLGSRLKLRRYREAKIPELTVKVRVESR